MSDFTLGNWWRRLWSPVKFVPLPQLTPKLSEPRNGMVYFYDDKDQLVGFAPLKGLVSLQEREHPRIVQ